MIDLPEKKVVRPRTCNQCGATWPYHYLDCPTDHVPGGVDLYEFNERERLEYENEKIVSKQDASEILLKIVEMTKMPKTLVRLDDPEDSSRPQYMNVSKKKDEIMALIFEMIGKLEKEAAEIGGLDEVPRPL